MNNYQIMFWSLIKRPKRFETLAVHLTTSLELLESQEFKRSAIPLLMPWHTQNVNTVVTALLVTSSAIDLLIKKIIEITLS